MSRLEYPAFDCDNHYYEALDAFTRHVPKAMQPRCVQWAEIDGRKHHLVGGKLAHAVRNPTWNPIAKPGVMSEYFRGNKNQRNPIEMLREREPLPAYYMDHDARLAKMDEQGLEAVWLFPTLGVLYEELLKHDTEAVTTLFRAFNQWLDEDWGVAYQGRIFGAPYITLADCDWACRELEWALGRGARIVVMRPAAVWTRRGTVSPADPSFDPFWARAERGGHHADRARRRLRLHLARLRQGRLQRRARRRDDEALGQGLQHRARRLRLPDHARVRAAVRALPEPARRLGGERLGVPVGHVPQAAPRAGAHARLLPGRPRRELFKRHVWINPFWEDDVNEVAELMGTDRVIFGSDWPHIEGMPQPLDYVGDLVKFDDAAKQQDPARQHARAERAAPGLEAQGEVEARALEVVARVEQRALGEELPVGVVPALRQRPAEAEPEMAPEALRAPVRGDAEAQPVRLVGDAARRSGRRRRIRVRRRGHRAGSTAAAPEPRKRIEARPRRGNSAPELRAS